MTVIETGYRLGNWHEAPVTSIGGANGVPPSSSAVVKVGPKGYIHGWIKVNGSLKKGTKLYRGVSGSEGANVTRSGELGSGTFGKGIYTALGHDLAVSYATQHRPSGVVMRGTLHPDAKVLDADKRGAIPKSERHRPVADYAAENGYDAVSSAGMLIVTNPSKVTWDPQNYTTAEASAYRPGKDSPEYPIEKVDVGSQVYQQLLDNYPPDAIQWVKDADWTGPIDIPQSQVDHDAMKSWAAYHEPARVNHFEEKIQNGEHVNPAVGVLEPGPNEKIKVIDGHHRDLAYARLGRPVKMYVGRVDRDDGPWNETHSSQFHQGSSPANKHFDPLELRNEHGEWESGANDVKELMPVAEAVKEYTYNGIKINKSLRTGTPVREDLQHVVDAMDHAAKPLGSAMTTYRGVNDAMKMFGSVGSKIGQEFHDDGFVSSSKDQSIAHMFEAFGSGSPYSAMIRINLKSGDYAVNVGNIIGEKEDAGKEFVLQRGTAFRVTGDEVKTEPFVTGEPGTGIPVRYVTLEVAK